jgi:hypothetical protein
MLNPSCGLKFSQLILRGDHIRNYSALIPSSPDIGADDINAIDADFGSSRTISFRFGARGLE